MKKKMRWEIYGYYIDYHGSWTLLRNEDGREKRVKGIK